MLTHGAPWQGVLAWSGIRWVIFASAMLLSLISGYFNWWLLFTAIFLAIGFFLIIQLIPTMLNLSRSFFKGIASLILIHISVTIMAFALHHMSAGLIGPSGPSEPSFRDALYFSVTTFTTLGYGDLQPLPQMRLATSVEAFAGMLTVALAVAMILFWCEENTVPPEMAFFDGYRRHKQSIQLSRIRIRTITGKERKLKDWRPPPQKGDSFYYDKERKEWLEVTPDTVLPDNTLVIGVEPKTVDD